MRQLGKGQKKLRPLLFSAPKHAPQKLSLTAAVTDLYLRIRSLEPATVCAGRRHGNSFLSFPAFAHGSLHNQREPEALHERQNAASLFTREGYAVV